MKWLGHEKCWAPPFIVVAFLGVGVAFFSIPVGILLAGVGCSGMIIDGIRANRASSK